MAVRLESLRFKSAGLGVYFLKVGQGLLVRETNHVDLDAASVGVVRLRPGLGMNVRCRRHGGPHPVFVVGVYVAQDGQHEIQWRHAAGGNLGLAGSGRPVRRALPPSASAFPWC